MQQMLLAGSIRDAYHAIASSGRAGTSELTQVLVNLLRGEQPASIPNQQRTMADLIRDSYAAKLTIAALMDNYRSGKLSPEMKQTILEALKQAKQLKHMRDSQLQAALSEAIEEIESGKPGGQALQKLMDDCAHERQHATGDTHHH
jgi:hypothetical protein